MTQTEPNSTQETSSGQESGKGGQPGAPSAETPEQKPGAEAEAGERKKELEIYGQLREKVKQLLTETKETVNRETITEAINKATAEIKEKGEHSAEATAKAVQALKKDIADAAHRMEPKWEQLKDKSADVFEVWRGRSSAFLAQAATALGHWLQEAGEKLEHPIYHTGELANRGTLECTHCGHHVTLKTPGHLPPCPHCHQTEYRRI